MNFSKTLTTDCLWLSNQAYSKNPSDCLERGLKVLDVLFNTETENVLYYNKKKNAIIVSFRGTSSKSDVLTDLKVFPSKAFGRNFRVHSGFLKAYLDTLKNDGLAEKVVRAIVETKADKLVFTGHSLGGALAMIAYLDFFEALKSLSVSSRVITFGQPRLLYGKARKNEFVVKSNLGEYALRIINGRDLVSKLPPFWMGYRHSGKVLQLPSRKYDMFGILAHTSDNYNKSLEKEFRRDLVENIV